MSTTSFIKAQIKPVTGGAPIDCMYNPENYTIKKSNTYRATNNNGSIPDQEFCSAGPIELTLSKLLFDTYAEGADVTTHTGKLLALMTPSVATGGSSQKKEPPQVDFIWGSYNLRAVITSMSQQFTLFLPNGNPARAEVDLTLIQATDPCKLPGTNPTSGGGPVERVWTVSGADRLDNIAYAVYGDSSKWRHIATRNRISHPADIVRGQILAIPELIR
ncbi:MAG: hypothetical protein ACPG8W_22265 [Candidatus Promineifilaceae bacterium]